MSWFTVPLMDFRAALMAVRPHAGNTVRLIPGDELHVVATDQMSAVVARVEITEREDGQCPVMEIDVDDIGKLLAVFKAPKDKEERGEAAVRIRPVFKVREPDDDTLLSTGKRGEAVPPFMAEVVFSDASGLFDGQSLTVLAATTDTPDVRGIIASALTRDPWLWEIEATLGPIFMGKLTAACKAYSAVAQLRYVQYGSGRIGLLATVGEKLTAFQVAAPVETNPSGVAWPEITRREWVARLRGLSMADRVEQWLHTLAAPTRTTDDDDDQPADADTDAGIPGQEELLTVEPDVDDTVRFVDFTEPRRRDDEEDQ